MKRNVAAFFDFDGTLFTGHLWQGVVEHHIRHKIKLLSVFTFLATNLPLALAGELASKLKILRTESYKIKWGEDLATLLSGIEKEEGMRIFEWVSNNYFTKLLRTDIVELLRRHKREGHITVLVSGSFDDFLEVIKNKLDMDHAVGTKLEISNNAYSGKILKPLCFGDNKAKLLQQFINERSLNIDLHYSYAYADSVIDVPMLEMVGNPVATYPDKKLSKLAQARGWRILP